jgi:CO dehydrogenase maturation factor
MKLAISGKGGVGKTTVTAILSLLLAKKHQTVLAVDADPDPNLATALGISPDEQQRMIPLSQQIALIEERTGAKVNQYGQVFKLNPEVADVADSYATKIDNISLLVLGAVEKGGGGCACPENVFIRSLVTDLILFKNETLVMDMEAGVEHLGRATVQGVDYMIIVVEPGQRSIESTHRIIRLSREIGIKEIRLIGNKVVDQDDEEFIQSSFPDIPIELFIPFDQSIRKSDKSGGSIMESIDPRLITDFDSLLDRLKSGMAS